MAEAPNKFSDPYWSQIAEAAGARNGVPAGVMSAIILHGERTNNDQIGRDGERSPFQILPKTRDLFLKKYGVDAYLSPENAANVAALHIKESLDRGASVPRAIGEYNGGSDPARWTKAVPEYVNRVLGGLSGKPIGAVSGQQPKSTFDRVLAEQSKPETQLAQIYDAYKSGKMTAKDAAEFEADVNAGKVMLPKGATVGAPSAQQSTALPAGVLEAYKSGQMERADMAELEKDVAAGMWILPQGEKLGKTDTSVTGAIKDVFTGERRRTATTDALPDWATMPELNQLSLASAKTGVGTMLSNPAETAQIIKSNFPEAKIRQDEKGNYLITSGVDGKEYAIKPGFQVSDIPRAIGALVGFTPAARAALSGRMAAGAGAAAGTQAVIEGTQAATGGEFNPADIAIAGVAGAALPAVGAAIPPVVQAVKNIATPAKNAIANVFKGADNAAPVAPQAAGGYGSVGAQGVNPAAQRIAKAEELGFTGPNALTQGQATRDFAAQRFERETAKAPDVGEPIRERFANQNRFMQQKLESWIDDTGAGAVDVGSVGASVNQALRDIAARAKARYRTLYREAEKAGELEGPVNISGVADYLNANRSGATSAPIMNTVARELQVQNIGGGSLADGTLKIGEGQGMGFVTLKQAEDLRKVINKFTKDTDPNDVRIAAEIKGLIDAATAGAGGQKYQQARAAFSRFQRDFTNVDSINKLTNRKYAGVDRGIAIEDILNKTVINPSASEAEVRHIRRLLQTGGESGQQAWKDIQGGVVAHIRDQATKNVARNELGDSVVSAAQLDRVITALDKSGKLQTIFGAQGASQLRALNDVAKDVLVPNYGAVNTSNTASVILAALDGAMMMGTGIPAPALSALRLASKKIKDSKTKARVKAALRS